MRNSIKSLILNNKQSDCDSCCRGFDPRQPPHYPRGFQQILNAAFNIRLTSRLTSIKFCMIFLCSLFAHNTFADSIYLGAWSYHFHSYPQQSTPKQNQKVCGPTDIYCNTYISTAKEKTIPQTEYNNQNNLIGIEFEGYGAGYFLNSYNQHTVFLEKQFSLLRIADFDLRANGGINYGYRGCNYKNTGHLAVCPDMSLEVSYAKYDIQPTIIFNTSMVAITTKWKF